MSDVAVVIPARLESTRLPRKLLLAETGAPLIAHTVRRVLEARDAYPGLVSRVLVAADHPELVEAARAAGADAVMTRPDHASGTDRIAEAVADASHDVIVNIQGDEPLIEGFVIDAAVDALAESQDAPMSTVVHAAEERAIGDPNRVKVVLDRHGHALYFSPNPVPARRPGRPEPHFWQHVGLYAYRREFLQEFVKLEQTPAELCEGLEQLRALENGFPIRCAIIEGWESMAVDVPDDVARVEARLATSG